MRVKATDISIIKRDGRGSDRKESDCGNGGGNGKGKGGNRESDRNGNRESKNRESDCRNGGNKDNVTDPDDVIDQSNPFNSHHNPHDKLINPLKNKILEILETFFLTNSSVFRQWSNLFSIALNFILLDNKEEIDATEFNLRTKKALGEFYLVLSENSVEDDFVCFIKLMSSERFY